MPREFQKLVRKRVSRLCIKGYTRSPGGTIRRNSEERRFGWSRERMVGENGSLNQKRAKRDLKERPRPGSGLDTGAVRQKKMRDRRVREGKNAREVCVRPLEGGGEGIQ